MSAVDAAVSALFIDSGILGRRTFAEFGRTAFERECDGVHREAACQTCNSTPEA